MDQPLNKKFSDALKREWVVRLPWSAAQRVKEKAGIGLDDLIPKADQANASLYPLHELITDGMKLFEVLWAIFEPECEAKRIDKNSFGEGFDGDTFVAAAQAFMGALHDFFPNPLRRAMVRQALAKGQRAMEIATARLNQEMDKIDVEKEFDARLSSLYTSTPVSRESIQAPTP